MEAEFFGHMLCLSVTLTTHTPISGNNQITAEIGPYENSSL